LNEVRKFVMTITPVNLTSSSRPFEKREIEFRYANGGGRPESGILFERRLPLTGGFEDPNCLPNPPLYL
jgi:hypothetical protein